MEGIRGKNVLITGANKGIGQAIALGFAKEGANVVINDICSENEAQATVDQAKRYGTSVYYYRADVTNRQQVQEMHLFFKETLGEVHVLVNNAGIAKASLVRDMSDEQWDQMIKVHLYGTFYNSREVIASMQAFGSGKMINISSDLASLGVEEFAHYSAAKGGIISLTKSLARELAPLIQVNAVAPGGTLTDILTSFGENYIEEEAASYPLKRLATPEEIAQSVLFLASTAGDFYTGQVLNPNGGSVMNG
ncbi:SDR family NAD(P)-dependent oxidoreductase [Shouchella shacheensis]|uniref:SDR family NAD(P)-dependent oxidoreductase n=1 Tax=Shouchella shacheensis TaxID=1649580 RepID=UPI00073FDC52|nr:SDR family oxidoreductase [Shouchella shacheensis]